MSMRPSTRSRSGVAKESGKGMTDGGSSVDVPPPSLDRVLLEATAMDGRQQVGTGELWVSTSDSSSCNSIAGDDVEVQPVDQGVDVGGTVAGQVLDELPHSGPTAVGKNLEPVSAAGVSQKGNENIHRGPRAPLADRVFVEMPQSKSAAVGVDRSHVSGAVDTQMGEAVGNKAPWVNLFKDNRNLGQGIRLEKWDSGDDMLQIDEEDVDDIEEAWGYCLVGQFAGRFPGMAAVRTIQAGWKVKCKHWIHRSGWIVFKFDTLEDRLSVLNGGPYFIYGRNLMLKNMPKCFRFGGEEIAIVPLWVQLPGLPLDCWNVRALSKIVSRIGKPITTDRLTHTKERLSFARVLVEVDASKELVTSVEMKLPTGDVYKQSVVFEYTPKYCKKCKSFGHLDGDCNLEGRKQSVYVPKKMVRPAAVTVNNKGEGAGTSKVAMDTAGVPAPLLVQSVAQEVGVPSDVVLDGGSMPSLVVPQMDLPPGNNPLPPGKSALPTSSVLRPVVSESKQDAEANPLAGQRSEGAKIRNKGKQKKTSDLGQDSADRPISVNLKGPSARMRESSNLSPMEKDTGVVVRGLQAVVKEKRPNCLEVEGGAPGVLVSSVDRTPLSASVSKGKSKGKSLQPSK